MHEVKGKYGSAVIFTENIEEEDMLEKEKEEKEYNDNSLTNIVNDIVNESEFGTATDKMLEILKYEEKKTRLMETTTYIMSELTKEKID